MKCLSMDCSTTKASIALLDGDRVVAVDRWFEERARHEGLFEVAGRLMAQAGWTWEELELFIVGRGPGAYSGLRVSLLAAQAWAAPGNRPVIAVSSMEAAGRAWMEREGGDEVVVAGDARRNTFWYGVVPAKQPEDVTAWRTLPCDQLAGILPEGIALLSPHEGVIPGARLLEVQAVDVAHLGLRRWRAGTATEPLAPLYMHAAV